MAVFSTYENFSFFYFIFRPILSWKIFLGNVISMHRFLRISIKSDAKIIACEIRFLNWIWRIFLSNFAFRKLPKLYFKLITFTEVVLSWL